MNNVHRTNNGLQIIEPEEEMTVATPQKITLHSLACIRREMASVYRDMRTGRIEPQTGTRLIYALDKLREAFKQDVLMERIETLETVLKARKP